MTRGCSSIPEVQRLLRVLAVGRRVGETGTAFGEGAAAMAETGVWVVTVEREPERAARARLARFPNVEALVGDWRDLLPQRGPYGLLFFDAGRLDEQDPDAIVALLEPGGLLVKDDLTPGRPGRARARVPARRPTSRHRRGPDDSRNGGDRGRARPVGRYAGQVAVRVEPVRILGSGDRQRLVRRARVLAWGGIGWHVVEFAIALGAGIAAGSIALVAFGADSLVEALAGFVVLWLFTGTRVGSSAAERRAQQLIAVGFYVLAAYVAAESVRTLWQAQHPSPSWVGIGLAAFTALTMPLLALAKRRVGRQLGSSATVKEASQTQLCAYLSAALLVGLLANAVAGWWWADPTAALLIAGLAAWEGRASWRGEAAATTVGPARRRCGAASTRAPSRRTRARPRTSPPAPS